LVSTVVTAQEEGMDGRAAKDVESGLVAQSLVDQGAEDTEETGRDKKEERRKKAAGGSQGGGAQGRQTKTKSTKDKKKGGKRKDDDWSDEEEGGGGGQGGKSGKGGKTGGKTELVYKSCHQLEEELRLMEQLVDCPEEVHSELAEHLVEQLNRRYREVARDRYQSTLASSLQNKRRSHTSLTDHVNTLHTTLRLGEKAVAEFAQEEHRASLGRYLLKEYGNEMVNEMFQYVAEENMVKIDQEKELSPEIRVKIIGQLPKDISEPALKIHKSVLGSSVSEFLSVLDTFIVPLCDVMLRKPDKKKDRQILFGHRQSLQEKLHTELDPALVLHLAVLLLFHHIHGSMLLQASGKFVPIIIEHLSKEGNLTSEQVSVLTTQQTLVVAGFGKSDSGLTEERLGRLERSTPEVKQMVAGIKKAGTE